MIFAEWACLEKKYLIEQTSLSRFTLACRINVFQSSWRYFGWQN